METQPSTMKFQVLFFLLLLACMYPSVAQGSYENCCLKYANPKRPIRRTRVTSFRLQEIDGGCNIHAVVLTLKIKPPKQICVDPKEPWVRHLIKILREKKTVRV